MIIKLFGLYCLIITLFQYLPSMAPYIQMVGDGWGWLIVIGMAAVIVGIYFFLLLKTDLIIDKLKLDKGFDDDRIVLGDLDSMQILSLATILIGGFLIIDWFPEFISNTIRAFKENIDTDSVERLYEQSEKVNYINWGLSVMNLIIGYALLTNYLNVAKWLNRSNELNTQ